MVVKIRVKLFSTLRELLGKNEVELKFDDAISVADLLNELNKRYGSGFGDYIYGKDGKVRSSQQFIVNGTSIAVLEGFETKLKDGDTIAILMAIAGG